MRALTGAVLLLGVAVVYAGALAGDFGPVGRKKFLGGEEGLLLVVVLGLPGVFFLLWGALTDGRATGAPPTPLSTGAKIGLVAVFTVLILGSGACLFMPSGSGPPPDRAPGPEPATPEPQRPGR